MKSSISDFMVIKGRIVDGLREAGFFTRLPWARQQFVTKLGIDPYPGTLNLDISDAEDVEKLREVKRRKGIEIIPAGPDFCSAKCFHVLVSGKVKGALIIPQIADYPESKLEIIASDRIRDILPSNVGDVVEVQIF
ncbi:MAG: CTP-dependent riboflavin kinase [Chloroflexi bacterium]|nr:CTP-dependent riboflavin kinase [Chloroflexota bacterium]